MFNSYMFGFFIVYVKYYWDFYLVKFIDKFGGFSLSLIKLYMKIKKKII